MGTLYVVATPIGNLEDITLRATKTLTHVDIILCEDTRRTGQMLSTLAIPHNKLLSYYDAIEQQRTPEIIAYLEIGKNIALVSDAGTPIISDPGYVLVTEARKRNIPIVSIPGASSLLTALTSSGLPADKFTFLGYPPEKTSHRKKLFEDLTHLNRFKCTYIFFCAPHKLITTLREMKDVFGDIEIVICRELTKIHEETWTGTLDEAQEKFVEPKGEFVLLFQLV